MTRLLRSLTLFLIVIAFFASDQARKTYQSATSLSLDSPTSIFYKTCISEFPGFDAYVGMCGFSYFRWNNTRMFFRDHWFFILIIREYGVHRIAKSGEELNLLSLKLTSLSPMYNSIVSEGLFWNTFDEATLHVDFSKFY